MAENAVRASWNSPTRERTLGNMSLAVEDLRASGATASDGIVAGRAEGQVCSTDVLATAAPIVARGRDATSRPSPRSTESSGTSPRWALTRDEQPNFRALLVLPPEACLSSTRGPDRRASRAASDKTPCRSLPEQENSRRGLIPPCSFRVCRCCCYGSTDSQSFVQALGSATPTIYPVNHPGMLDIEARGEEARSGKQ